MDKKMENYMETGNIEGLCCVTIPGGRHGAACAFAFAMPCVGR